MATSYKTSSRRGMLCFGSSFGRCFTGSGPIQHRSSLLEDYVYYNRLSSFNNNEDDENIIFEPRREKLQLGKPLDLGFILGLSQDEISKLGEEHNEGDEDKNETTSESSQTPKQSSTSSTSSSSSNSSASKLTSFGSRVKEACGQMLEAAKKSSPHMSELFVGNQLLMSTTIAALPRYACSLHPGGLGSALPVQFNNTCTVKPHRSC